MLSMLANIGADIIFNRPKITKDVIVATIFGGVAFLFLTVALIFGLLSLNEYLTTLDLSPTEGAIIIASGSILIGLLFAGLSYFSIYRIKQRKQQRVDKLLGLAESFLSGFSESKNAYDDEDSNIATFTRDKVANRGK